MGEGLIPGPNSEDGKILSGKQTLPDFSSLSPKWQGYPKSVFIVKSLISTSNSKEACRIFYMRDSDY